MRGLGELATHVTAVDEIIFHALEGHWGLYSRFQEGHHRQRIHADDEVVPYDAGDIIVECGSAVACRNLKQERGEFLVRGVDDLHLEGLNKQSLRPKEVVD